VKYGTTREFGPADFKREVKKAILPTDTENYNFVLVFVVQKLATFFNSPERNNEKYCETIFNTENKPLAIQFFPGYEMSIKHRKKEIIEIPKSKKKKSSSTRTVENWVVYTEKWRIPDTVQTVVLFDDGFRVLLGKPIHDFICSGHVMDKALFHLFPEELQPDPILLNTQPQILIVPQNEDEVMVDVNDE